MMSEQIENSKRIAKNTVVLYIRMLLLLFISFFTSRVILQSLGVVDYGIYNVVGGVVAMFSFFNAALSGATSRFLTFELGSGNFNKLKRTFQSSLYIHVFLAVLIAILLETVGLWFVYNKLVLPTNRFEAALIVYHISVCTLFLNIMQVPFSASITSHEKMTAFAYIGIYDAIMKLFVAYLLFVATTDRLILYSSLLALSSLSVNAIYVYYCMKHFPECTLSIRYEKEITKPMISFSSWDLIGSLSVIVRGQGTNILQNTFFGPVVNASTGVANTVLNAIMGFTDNFLTAVRPQIVKQYAAGNYDMFETLTVNSARYSYLLLLFFTIPLLFEAEFAMNIWLTEVPQFAVLFCQLSIVNNWVSIMFRPTIAAVSATGYIKRLSIYNGLTYMLVIPIAYVMFRLGFSPATPFVLNIILLALGHSIFTMTTLKRYAPFFNIRRFYLQVCLHGLFLTMLVAILPGIIHYLMPYGFGRFVVVCTASVIWGLLIIFFIGINKNERIILIGYAKRKVLKSL